MSKYIIDEQTCINVSNAIRAKTQTSGTMSAAQWAGKIRSIVNNQEPFYTTTFTLETGGHINGTILTKSAIGSAIRQHYSPLTSSSSDGKTHKMLVHFNRGVVSSGTTYDFVECWNIIEFNWKMVDDIPTAQEVTTTVLAQLCYNALDRSFRFKTSLTLSDIMNGVVSANSTTDHQYGFNSGDYTIKLYDLADMYVHTW